MIDHQYLYRCDIIGVVDGDTVDAEVDLGFFTYTRIRFRLYGINTPERGQEGFKEATNHITYLLGLYPHSLYVESRKTGKYGRWLGTFYGKSERTGEYHNLNEEMVTKGYAVEYMKK